MGADISRTGTRSSEDAGIDPTGAASILLPAIQFSPTLSYLAILLGLWFNMINMLWIGIFFFGLMVLFSILTLPVEIDASRRSLQLLREADLFKSKKMSRSPAAS